MAIQPVADEPNQTRIPNNGDDMTEDHTPDNPVRAQKDAHDDVTQSDNEPNVNVSRSNDVPLTPAPQAPPQNVSRDDDEYTSAGDYDDRLERLGGEPAPVITPEEFARLQKAGQVHIDSRGRVRTARRTDTEGGVSLRKRRAWYNGCSVAETGCGRPAEGRAAHN